MPVIAVSQLNRAPGAARRPRAAARRPARVRRHRAGRRHGDVHLRGPQRPRLQGRGQAQDRQAPQRPHGPRAPRASCGTTRSSAPSARPRTTTTRSSGPPRRSRPGSRRMSVRTTVFSAPGVDPVALLRELGLEGEAPVVLLDSAGGSAELARRHYLAWDPVFRLRVRARGRRGHAGAGRGRRRRQARALAERARALTVAAAVRGAARRHAARGRGRAGARRRAGAGAGRDFPEAERALRAHRLRRGALPGAAAGLHARRPRPARHRRLPAGQAAALSTSASGEAVFLDRIAGGRPSAGGADARRADARARVRARALERARTAAAATLHSNDMPVFRSNFTRAEYEAVVARTREYVFAGDIFQANLSQRLDGMYALPSLHLYATLRAVNPSPFAGYLHFGDYELISSSPERLVSLGRDGWAETRPIAGTRPRGDRAPRGRRAGRGAQPRPQGPGRAHHARRPRAQRPRAGSASTARCASPSSWSTSTTRT